MDALKVIGPTVLTFFIGIFITPFFTRYFYKYKMWRKSPRTESDVSEKYQELHDAPRELSTPRIGGVIIWMSVLLTVVVIFALSILFPAGLFGGKESIFNQLNFFSRSQTLVPLGAFFFAAAVGLIDDLLQIFGQGSAARDPLIYRKVKTFFITLIGIAIAFWFYYKLDFVSVHVPFLGEWFLGIWFIPFFVIVVLATWSTSVIDGLDGLAGGVLASCFSAFAIIAFVGEQYDISALSGAITGGILAFLWFNVPPARFYMGETGMISLTILLAVIAFLTDSVLLLPVIALPLVATSVSVILQVYIFWKLFRKKIFLVTPLHHHFQALGWPREKVVMRYWIVSVISAATGVILYLVS